MYLFSRRPVYAAVFFAFTGQAIAESSVPPIFITAGRVAEPVEETLFSTSTVTQEEIERQRPRDVGDILGQLPGIQIGRNGGAGQVTSAFIRGAASDHTLLLVDGVPVNSGTVGQPALEHFMPDQIDRIEVVRGPASTLYGSSAIGGVVQIFTKRRTSGQSASLTAGGGSENSRNVAGSFDYGKQGAFANLSFSYRDTDGYEVRPSVLSVDRGYDNSSFNGAVGHQLGDFDIELSYFQSEGVAEYVGTDRATFAPVAVDQDTLNSVARVALTYDPASSWRSRLLLSRVRDEVEQNQFEDFAKTERDYVDWQNTVSVDDRHTVVGGVTASWTDTRLLSFAGTFFESRYNESIRSTEYYLQDTIDLDDTRFQVGGRIIDNEVYGTNYTWNLAIGHRLTPETRLHANAGTAFRTPSANDLYLASGNPDFDPETSTSVEAGVTHAATPFDSFRLVGFQTEIEDLIETDIDTFVVTQTEKARVTGLELGYVHRSSHWAWSFDYTYMDPKNLDVDQLLARRARNTFDAALAYEYGKWWTQANLRYQSERRNSRFDDTMLDAYTTVGLGAGYRFSPSVSITGRVDNLFDEEYELAATYPAQGRFFSAELRYDFTAD